MDWEVFGEIELFKFKRFDFLPYIKHGVTSRRGGVSEDNCSSLNISFKSGDKEVNVIRNRKILSEYFTISSDKLFFPDQCHTEFVREVTASTLPEELIEIDAIITNQAGVCLGVLAADCVPILLFDPENKAIAAIHAGWKGTVNRIVARCVEQMVKIYGSHPGKILAGLGPAISYKHFEVGDEVAKKFRLLFEDVPQIFHLNEKTGKTHIDLWEANRQLLIRCGLAKNLIEVSSICTFDHPNEFYSARRDGFNTGRFAACIMLV